jgi:hypothetical protein
MPLKQLIFFVTIIFLLSSEYNYSQGLNHSWLLGYNVSVDSFTTSTKARLCFDSSSVTVIPEIRKLAFRASQANISDENGNLLVSTNGCWIANALGDTMMNGSGLNPGPFADDWCTSTKGMPFSHSTIILPFPGDSLKYYLFHQTSNYLINNLASELFYTVIDLSLNGGLGGVIPAQKNVVLISDTIDQGIAACKHANGRDWWIVILKDNTDIAYTILLTPSGPTIINTQHMNLLNHDNYGGQPLFSPDGNKFAYTLFYPQLGTFYHDIRLFNFDRCTGLFSNPNIINVTDSMIGFSLAFSSNSKYLYSSSSTHIFQINTDSSTLYVDTIATNDGYASPFAPFYTDFWLMYLAANGRIYISTGNGTQDLHYITYPDSAGAASGIVQHGLHLPCWAARANVNHPNYYLGPVVGSTCDSLPHVGIDENNFNFHFSVSPNPSNGSIKIVYMMPQNKSGVFSVFNIFGEKIYSMTLPRWSSLQYITFPKVEDGIYYSTISSGNSRITKKIVLIK